MFNVVKIHVVHSYCKKTHLLYFSTYFILDCHYKCWELFILSFYFLNTGWLANRTFEAKNQSLISNVWNINSIFVTAISASINCCQLGILLSHSSWPWTLTVNVVFRLVMGVDRPWTVKTAIFLADRGPPNDRPPCWALDRPRTVQLPFLAQFFRFRRSNKISIILQKIKQKHKIRNYFL